MREISEAREPSANSGALGGALTQMGSAKVDASGRSAPERQGRPRFAAERILVVRLGSLGDVVRTRFALPALRGLYPDAHIDWLVEDRCAAGLTGVCEIDGILTVPRKQLQLRNPVRFRQLIRHTVEQLRSRTYDLAIDFHSILKSALLLRLVGVPVRIGYGRPLAREGAQHFYTHRCSGLPSSHLSRFERNQALVRFLTDSAGEASDEPGNAPGGPRLPDLQLAPEDVESLPPLPERFVVLHPGTSESTLYKRWPAQRYSEVALRLAEYAGIPSVVTWGPVPGERECAEQVVAGAPHVALLGPQTRSLGALLALLERSRLYIGSDSGPMHLASLVGRPCVALFGPTDPVENAPFPGVPSRLLQVDVGCNPCREGCPARSCMAALEPTQVIAAALELLEMPR